MNIDGDIDAHDRQRRSARRQQRALGHHLPAALARRIQRMFGSGNQDSRFRPGWLTPTQPVEHQLAALPLTKP